MSKPTLCLDFDGVIHSYTSGWAAPTNIPDPPVPGALEFIEEAVKHFRVAIFSSRSGHPGGIEAMQAWLGHYMIEAFIDMDVFDRIEWPTAKPPAKVTLDDRAVTFKGKWPSVESLLEFEPWNKRD